MSLLGNIVIAFAKVFSIIANLYTFIIAAAVLISWLRPDPYHPIVTLIRQATEPIFRPIRKKLPKALMNTGIDWTPMIVILVLVFLDTVVTNTLHEWGMSLKMK